VYSRQVNTVCVITYHSITEYNGCNPKPTVVSFTLQELLEKSKLHTIVVPLVKIIESVVRIWSVGTAGGEHGRERTEAEARIVELRSSNRMASVGRFLGLRYKSIRTR
jgi:hypothetical protein